VDQTLLLFDNKCSDKEIIFIYKEDIQNIIVLKIKFLNFSQ